jgi:hypothetical protein
LPNDAPFAYTLQEGTDTPMGIESLTAEHESTKLGQYCRQVNRRLHKHNFARFDFDERISLAGAAWFFDRQPVIESDKSGGHQPTGTLPAFMAYAVNEYGGVDNLLRFMDIKVDFVLSLS